jgi:hypothetical protein
MGTMKTKKIEKMEYRLRDVWHLHAFSRRDLKDKMQQSRLRMLMGAADPRGEGSADTAASWW